VQNSDACPMSDLANLPDGTFVSLERAEAQGDDDENAWLIMGGALHRWTHYGYSDHIPIEHWTARNNTPGRQRSASLNAAAALPGNENVGAPAGEATPDAVAAEASRYFRVITPMSTVRTLAEGYIPQLPDPSALVGRGEHA